MTDARLPPAVTVSVGMLTFRRPDRLAIGLPEVIRQLTEMNARTGRNGEVLVIDNDPDGSAREYVTALVAADPVVRYVHEPTPGIAAARQRCLQEAAAADLLLFIDDDETPAENWVSEMVRTWADHGRPAGVRGRIYPRYLSPPPAFVSAGGFFDRVEYPTGTPVPGAPTSNLLIDLGQVRALGLGFDLRLGLRGGEDTLFTRQLVAAGGRIVFCLEGAVYDLVPDDRNNREWVLKRAWHYGATQSLVSLMMVAGKGRQLPVKARLAGIGAARCLIGVARALYGRVTGSLAHEARGLRALWRGRGEVSGALTWTPPEYQR